MLTLTCLGLAVPVWALAEADWLYAVERPVAAQSNAERQRAAADGLLEVLSRLTGLTSVPRSAEINAALARPSAYYNQFVFFTEDDPVSGEEQTFLRITFQRSAIQELIKSSNLPVWWSRRPQIMAWLVLDNGGRREILGSESQHPLATALKQRAAQRGLSLTLPLMDLDDQLAVSSGDVWGKVAQTLDAAAARYGADLVLVGRVSRSMSAGIDIQPFRGDWEVWLDGQPLAENFTALDALSAGQLGVDLIADRLAEKFSVLPRALGRQPLSVTGLRDPSGYAEFMRYISSLEFVDRVDVVSIQAETLYITLDSRAQLSQLKMLLTAEGRLTEDMLHRGFAPQLIWQG